MSGLFVRMSNRRRLNARPLRPERSASPTALHSATCKKQPPESNQTHTIFSPLLYQLELWYLVIGRCKDRYNFNTAIVWQKKIWKYLVQREWKSFSCFDFYDDSRLSSTKWLIRFCRWINEVREWTADKEDVWKSVRLSIFGLETVWICIDATGRKGFLKCGHPQ